MSFYGNYSADNAFIETESYHPTLIVSGFVFITAIPIFFCGLYLVNLSLAIKSSSISLVSTFVKTRIGL